MAAHDGYGRGIGCQNWIAFAKQSMILQARHWNCHAFQSWSHGGSINSTLMKIWHHELASRLGLAGLGILLALFACIPPIGIELTQSYLGSAARPGFLIESILIESFFLPPVVSLTIAIAAVYFWHVPISVRYLVAVTLSIPASTLFLVLLSYFEEPITSDFIQSFFALIFALFVGAGATARNYSDVESMDVGSFSNLRSTTS